MSDPTQDSKTMTQYPTAEAIEAGALEFGSRHANCCYPQAMDFECNLAAEAIYLAMRAKEQSHADEMLRRISRWSGQGGEAHKLMVVLACADRHECDDMEPDGPREFIDLDMSIVETLNDLLGELRDFEVEAKEQSHSQATPEIDALMAVVDAVRDYLPPDGISKDECLNRIIGAVDNPEINPLIRELEHGRD